MARFTVTPAHKGDGAVGLLDLAADDDGVAVIEGVAARAAGEHVAALAAGDAVVARIAGDAVAAARADDVLEAADDRCPEAVWVARLTVPPSFRVSLPAPPARTSPPSPTM